MTGKGHPLPGSNEARHNEIPEHLERDKGRGDDSEGAVQPAQPPVAPDGEPYRYDDLGRGPGATNQEEDMQDDRTDEMRKDAPADTPRNQQQSGQSGGGRQVGGGPSPSDMAAPGCSSGEGYGNAQNQQMHQGQQDGTLSGGNSDDSLSRGERFDEQQGGGREDRSASELQQDQQAHQDRGQSIAESEERED